MGKIIAVRNEPSPSLSLIQEIQGIKKMEGLSYGQCDECGCPAFAGEGTYCARDSCNHHWKSHKPL
jgi:hypothetical protein